MKKTALAAIAFVFSVGLAEAQTTTAAGPAGTVGAMADATYGIATSAEDVVLQQRGMATMAQGAKPLATAGTSSVGSAPGTVGAAPGSMPGE